MIPEQIQIGPYKVLHNVDIGLVTVQKPGLLVPEVVYTISYDDRMQAAEKQAEAVKWAEEHK